MNWLLMVVLITFTGELDVKFKDIVQTPTKDISQCHDIGQKKLIEVFMNEMNTAKKNNLDAPYADGFEICIPRD